MYFIGHDTCRVNNGEHNTGGILGLGWKYNGVTSITNFKENDMNVAKTVIHEFGHLYGIIDHYGGSTKTTEEMNELYGNYFSTYCIYGENRNKDETLQDLTICQGCLMTLLENKHIYEHNI